ncbi:MAG: hypothetical protein NTX98_02440 [Candidatus Doudnabacteria bacterium]|nr:hypothetical protein [Candidatus Doudnabacteria bacterium]
MKRLFSSQQEDEEIYLVVREHWFHLFLKIAMWLIFVIALLVFNRFVPLYAPGLFEEPFGNITKLFTQVYTLFLVLSLFLIWVLYYLNMQIITDRRIVDIHQ